MATSKMVLFAQNLTRISSNLSNSIWYINTSHIKIFIKEELKLVNKQMNEKKSNIENKILEKELQLWKQEQNQTYWARCIKIFGKNKDNINDNKFDLDFDVSTISSRLADGTIDSCSCISDSSVIQMTGNCGFAHTYWRNP